MNSSESKILLAKARELVNDLPAKERAHIAAMRRKGKELGEIADVIAKRLNKQRSVVLAAVSDVLKVELSVEERRILRNEKYKMSAIMGAKRRNELHGLPNGTVWSDEERALLRTLKKKYVHTMGKMKGCPSYKEVVAEFRLMFPVRTRAAIMFMGANLAREDREKEAGGAPVESEE